MLTLYLARRQVSKPLSTADPHDEARAVSRRRYRGNRPATPAPGGPPDERPARPRRRPARGRRPGGADALRAYAARTRENADLLAGVLEDIALNGLPDPAVCTPWEELRERKLAQLYAARGNVA